MPIDNDGTTIENTDLGNETINAFMSSLLPEKDKEKDASEGKPSEKTDSTTRETEEKPTEETSDESPEETNEDGSEEETTEEKPAKKYVETDDVFVKVKVGDEELEVPVKDLKRLAGQEAALTRRSQEVAEQRRQVEQKAQQHAAALDHLMQRAKARADQFRSVDFLALAKDERFTAEQLTALQQEAQIALQDEAFLKQEVNKVVDAARTQMQTLRATQAQETVKALTDQASPLYIEGFNKQTYGELIKFAKDTGIDPVIADELVDAAALKIIHMAMLFKKGSSKVIKTEKINKTPKKIVKTSSSPTHVAKDAKSTKKAEAMKELKKTGSVEAAQAAFLASMGVSDNKE